MDPNKRPDDMVRITTPELAQAFIDEQVTAIREQIGDKKVLLALSGGVDSSVVAALLIKAIGKQLICVHVNHGLMRKGESEQVVDVFKNQMDANLVYVDATDRFLDKLVDVEEPEAKRKIIGAEFIRVFEEEARKVGDEVSFLAQGTIYPDILESQDGVKAHHNVGGLPEDLQFELCEPVKLLYKDEVRVVGRELGLPENMVERQPFPGPGLGVRCLGAITRDRLEALREADAIVREEIDKAGLTIWQYFAVVPDFRATGVREGKRAYDWPCIIRCINTVDVMTAEVPELDWALLKRITARVTAEVPGICRVCYDLTPQARRHGGMGVSFYSFGRIALTERGPAQTCAGPLSFYCLVYAAVRFGRVASMVVPFLELASTSTVPPCSAAISQTSASPSPAPPYALLRDLSRRKNGWKMLSRYCLGIPGPSSLTRRSTWLSLSLMETLTVEPGRL